MRVSLTPYIAFLGLSACDVPEALRGRVRVLTPHEQYGSALRFTGLDSTALGRDWLLASDSALRAPLEPPIPFHEAAFYSRSEARAVAFRFALARGRRLSVEIWHDGLPVRLFADLFRQREDTMLVFDHQATAERVESAAESRWVMHHEVRDSGTYVLRLQPELLRDGRYELTVRAEPVLAFPVQGGSNRSVQSFFGADRDAGRRQHHGIDIFAARGTPVLAATDGFVRSISPNDLGGNVVWLSDRVRGQTLYYAHLDAHVVTAGQGVRQGDTLGFVGNTGNARTTRPHLHFGIYQRGQGPVDPWPYVRLATVAAAPIVADTARLGTRVVAAQRGALVRREPRTGADSLRTVDSKMPLTVVGAQGAWYRVQLTSGESGYVAARAVGPMQREVAGEGGRREPRAGSKE